MDDLRKMLLGEKAALLEEMENISEEWKTEKKEIATALYMASTPGDVNMANLNANFQALKKHHGEYTEKAERLREIESKLGER